MKLLIILSILGLGQSIDMGSLMEIEEVMDYIKGLNNRLSEASDELNGLEIEGKKNYAEIIDKYLLQVAHPDKDGEDYQRLKDLVEKIDKAWNDLRTKELGGDEKSQLADLAKTREELYNLYVGNKSTEGLPAQVATGELPLMCTVTVPEQYRLKKVHQAVVLSELRALILCLKSGQDNQKEVATGIMRLAEYIVTSKLGFEYTNDYYRACDPPKHVRGKTFGEFVGFLQGMIVNVYQNGVQDACDQDCDAIDNSRLVRCFKESGYCQKKSCYGRIFYCLPMGYVDACEMNANSDRRFPWALQIIDNTVWGKKDNCNGAKIIELEQIGTWYYTCHNCMCICAEEDNESNAIRTFSLIPQLANIMNNMIVTGVRFQESSKMFHVQIEESKLGALGEIVPGTSKWKKLNSFTYDRRTGTFSMRERLGNRPLQGNADYKIFDGDSRAVNFDLVRTPVGEVIVGVSLRYNDEDDAVELQILSWPFDFKTGELQNPVNLEAGEVDLDWITWENTPKKHKNYDKDRFWFSIKNLDVPTLAPKNWIFSKPNNKLKFWVTGAKIDMSQHTVPFIDIQDHTYPDHKAPLSGLELTYSRARGYGGFLGFRLKGYDLTEFYKDEMTQEDIDKYKADFDGELPREIPVKSG